MFTDLKKKNYRPRVVVQKKFWGGSIWEFPGDGTPQLCQIICLLNIYPYQKT